MCSFDVRAVLFARFRDDPAFRAAVLNDPIPTLRAAGIPDSPELRAVLARIDRTITPDELIARAEAGSVEW
jgi:hypothetical protein